jgi:hypothetical protein
MSQISLTSSDHDDKSYEWKKLKKACKKVKSIASGCFISHLCQWMTARHFGKS